MAAFKRPRQFWSSGLAVVLAGVLGACAAGDKRSGATADENMVLAEAPFRSAGALRTTETYQEFAVAAAHPLASQAALDILKAGGSAVDAAIAAQMVLTMAEPQSSGVGGGGFLLHFDNQTNTVASYDGRETAPAGISPTVFLKAGGAPMQFHDAAVGGQSVGVPGLVRMLELAHSDHGNLPWRDLFTRAIQLAEDGFLISERLADQIARDRFIPLIPETKAYFYQGDEPKPAGTLLKNPELAAVFRALAEEGADAFYNGEIADAIVERVRNAPFHQSTMTADDVSRYQAKRRPAVCRNYRSFKVCGMGPPSSGGVATLQILGLWELTGASAPFSPGAFHRLSEASRLAFADRNAYLADSDFITVPAEGLLDRDYLRRRSFQISPAGASPGRAAPGRPGLTNAPRAAPGELDKGRSTTHLSIIDSNGDAVSLTSSIETAFGSRLMVKGFLLNNQLTDFSFHPERNGAPAANRAAPGKRPRSSMSPTIVLDAGDRLRLVIGSPGGSRIIGYVAKTLIGVLDWKLSVKAAIDLPHVLNRNRGIEVEEGLPAALRLGLERLGHKVEPRKLTSGLQGLEVTPDGRIRGGADRRREGKVMGR